MVEEVVCHAVILLFDNSRKTFDTFILFVRRIFVTKIVRLNRPHFSISFNDFYSLGTSPLRLMYAKSFDDLGVECRRGGRASQLNSSQGVVLGTC